MPKLSRLRSTLANKSWSAYVAPRHQRRVRVNKMKGPKECCAVSVYVKRHFFFVYFLFLFDPGRRRRKRKKIYSRPQQILPGSAHSIIDEPVPFSGGLLHTRMRVHSLIRQPAGSKGSDPAPLLAPARENVA